MLPVFPHYRCSECSPQERYPYFLTAPAVSAPAGALPKFPHCRSSARSSRKPFPPSPLLHPPPPPLFPHCRSSACSSRSLSPPPLPPSIFSLPQQCLLQQEPLPPPPPLPNSPHATMGIPPPQLFLHYRSSACSSRNLLSIFPTTAVVPAPTGFFSICPHCPSSDRSRRSAIYFPTTAVVAAPAGALSPFSYCPSSACPRRSFPFVSPLP